MPVSDDRAATPPDGKIAVARACGRLLTVPPAEPTTLFDLGMLHDIGVSSTATHNHLLLEFDWEGSQQHCDIGYRLLRDFPPLARLAEPVRYHHTHWEELAAMPDLSPVVAEQANLIYLVDRVDTLAAPHYGSGELLMHTAGIRDKIAARAGRYFEPDLVEAFLTASATEAFWLELEPRGIQSVMQEMLIQAVPYPATIAELKQLAAMFSQIVDAPRAWG